LAQIAAGAMGGIITSVTAFMTAVQQLPTDACLADISLGSWSTIAGGGLVATFTAWRTALLQLGDGNGASK
jgi:hypothetical protein